MNRKADWSLFHTRLHQKLRQDNLLPKQANILIAVSGGQDSLCLSKLLLDLQPKWQWNIAIAHCDHNWSTDAGIADHVEKIATKWLVSFYLKQASNLKETEAAARKWRYQALIEIADTHNFNYIVTGHTKSDRAETFLYNLIRGAGADGLSSLSWQRNLTDNIVLVRPILDFTRSETLEFCQQFELPIWVDAVNSNLKYARNRIRQDLIPYLQDNFNPQVENALVQTVKLLRADTQYLEAQATNLSATIIHSDYRQLNRLKLQPIPLALQRRIIRQFLPQVIAKQPNFAQIEAVRNLINAPNKTRTSTLAKGIAAEVSGEWIVFKGMRDEG
ncbi:tRNA(Ile)-lysidine synthase [Hyella patelloides LEGE 07179]|uniref:tRNA(Ile)-lysidine synthase n=1 Tax=Hyella patelloides LEGE 07179 TaxID=945734 RepID=A0A563VIT3_9CYAN|nr:tRNA lysidine(34) synthetase TilS [Hyella patelloides]VEP11291.1 tRNA(Ile)-lysidine synthase [Hyella patelloides LEGE 07179]